MTTTNTGVLLIGSMGHIGGAVLDQLVKTYPELRITAVVRSGNDSILLEKQYKHVKLQTQVGSLEDPNLMERLSRNATIVINCGPDIIYAPGIQALLRGQATQGKPTYYIGTTGAAIIWDAPTGDVEGRIWDDVADIDEIRARPDSSTHFITDQIVLDANTPLLRTAMISPCFVTGVSPSITHSTPLVFPDWLYVVKSLDSGVTVSKGVNRLSFVDVEELGRLYTALVGDALGRFTGEGRGVEDVEVWGPKAYYFAASMETSMRQFMRDHLVPALKRYGAPYPSSEEIKVVSLQTIQGLVLKRLGGDANAELWSGPIAEAFGVNMRVRGTRAEKALGFAWSGGDAGIESSVKAFLRN